jgi:hypothetical protein
VCSSDLEIIADDDGIQLAGNVDADMSIDNVSVRKVLNTGYSLSKPFIVDMMHRGDGGIYPMPWQGTVKAFRSLDSMAVAYCDDGVMAMVPNVALTTFGTRRLVSELGQSPSGFASRSAVGGDEYTHMFVDNSGALWKLSEGGKLEFLDCRWLFESLSDIVVSFQPANDTFYLAGVSGSSQVGYMFDLSGALSQTPECYTSIVLVNGGSVGIPAGDVLSGFRAVTGVLDMGTRTLKTVRGIELGVTHGAASMTVAVEYRTEAGTAAWMRSASVPIQGKGAATFAVTGVEFRIAIEGTEYSSVEISYIRIFWEPNSKTNMKRLLGGFS